MSTITVHDGQGKNPTVLTEVQYNELKATGMLWEFHPDAPLQWPTPTPVATLSVGEIGDRIAANAALLRLFQGEYRNSGDRHSDALFAKEYVSTLERELASAQAEIENLVWNLAGCDTLAMGYCKPGEFSKELARPALHSVSKLAARVTELERQLAEAGKLCKHGIPFYAYGDNQAACELANRIEQISDRLDAARALKEGV